MCCFRSILGFHFDSRHILKVTVIESGIYMQVASLFVPSKSLCLLCLCTRLAHFTSPGCIVRHHLKWCCVNAGLHMDLLVVDTKCTSDDCCKVFFCW